MKFDNIYFLKKKLMISIVDCHVIRAKEGGLSAHFWGGREKKWFIIDSTNEKCSLLKAQTQKK